MASANKGLRKQGFCVGKCSGVVGGSALILVVVLTSLLAIVGVMFVMVSRIDRMATSGISEDKQLDLAVDTVVGKISGQLVWDVPGTILPSGGRPEYHDYPGPEDRWLAASEPNNVRTWPQISDVTGYLGFQGWPTRNILLTEDPAVPVLFRAEIPDDRPIALDPADGSLLEQLADADGDGVADSKWVVLDGVSSSRGEPIYAAVRVTDNGGKININTAFEFDPGSPDVSLIDGASLWQINLMALANRPYAPLTPAGAAADEKALLWARANNGVNLDPCDLAMYEHQVTWRYGELSMPYTPFDISDELELRNRFLLNQRETYARIEQLGDHVVGPDEWTGAFRIGLKVPIGQGGSDKTVDDWFDHANISLDPNLYDYRHLATTYSMDRIINPLGLKMANVNRDTGDQLYLAIREALWDAVPTLPDPTAGRLAAQIAANVKDFGDDDSVVTTVQDVLDPKLTVYYGFECPCIYISEVAGIIKTAGVPPITWTSYAVELHKPYFEDGPPPDDDWRLKISDTNIPIHWTGSRRFHVVRFEDPGVGAGTFLPVAWSDTDEPNDPFPLFGYSKGTPVVQDIDASVVPFGPGMTIELQRSVSAGYITIDSFTIPDANGDWLSTGGAAHSIQRDINRHKCIRRFWDTPSGADPSTLGQLNTYTDTSDTAVVQAHPYLDPASYTNRLTGVGFKNIGEIGMVFDVNAYNVPVGSTEPDLRLDPNKPLYARIFNYLTVFDPANHGHPWNETRVKGRININTAPSFVLEQLPWIVPPVVGVGAKIVDMVVAYRDKQIVWSPLGGVPGCFKPRSWHGLASIGELTRIQASGYPGYYGMDYYGADGGDQVGFPDLTPLKLLGAGDGAADDIEERDLIFHRISNLVTVRSDVFTAYILVRIGTDGPQRRVVAILDRSDVEPNNANTKVKVRALHKTADPW